MVYGEHVAGSESPAEEVDDACEECPPCSGTAEEPGDDEDGTEESADGMVRHFAARDLEYGEEGEDVGDHHDEISEGESEYGCEVLPEGCFSGAVPSDLRDGVLCEDEDADDDDEDSADYPQQGVVLLDLGLEHRVEEQGDHGHEGVGACDADSGDDSGAPVLGERALDAEHGDGPDGDRGCDADADAAEEGFNDIKCHIAGMRVWMTKIRRTRVKTKESDRLR